MRRRRRFSAPDVVAAPTALDLDDLRRQVVDEVPDLLDLPALERRLRVAMLADRSLGPGDATPERAEVLAALVDDLAGLGPLEALLADGDVTEIMVNGPDEVYVEVGGELRRTAARFRDAEHLLSVVNRVIGRSGRRIDEGAPMVDACLEDGSRVNAVLPPVAPRAAQLTIRRPPRRRLGMEQLISLGAVDPTTAAFLHAAVLGRCNVMVTGGSGTGKTTLLAALCELVPDDQRLLVLEDVAELTAEHPHLVRQQGRPPAPDGGREVTLRDLVRNGLRMRPDRLIVGEVRGAEAADMLTAMNTGHPGSMTTLHANSSEDALTRLETMLALALPAIGGAALQAWLASVLDVIVHCERRPGGVRRVAEVAAVDTERGRPRVTTVYARDRLSGMRPAGEIPRRCLQRMHRHGVRFPVRHFSRTGVA